MLSWWLVPALVGTTLSVPDTIWSRCYDGPAHQEDEVTGLLWDSTGSYLTGFSFGGPTDFDFATVKVSAQGETLWARRYGSPLNCEDRIWCSAQDSAGNIVTGGGTIADFQQGWDFLVIKYRPDGETCWLRRLDFPEHGDDKPAALAITPDNGIVITGTSRHRPDSTRGLVRSDWDIATVKLSPQGDTVWTRLCNGPAGQDDYGCALAIDREGNSYIAGKVVTRPPATDIVLLKFDGRGNRCWQQTIDGPGQSSDFPAGVLLCPRTDTLRLCPRTDTLRFGDSDRLYLWGTVTGKGTGFDYLVASFDLQGRLQWLKTYDCDHRVDICQAACLDQEGAIIVTGQSTGRGSSFDIVTLKFSSSGQLLWQSRYNGPYNGADRGYCVTADSDVVLVGGSSEGGTGYPDLVLLRLAGTTGDTLGTFRYPSGGAGASRAVAIKALADRILVAGHTFRPRTGFDYLLVCLKRKGF